MKKVLFSILSLLVLFVIPASAQDAEDDKKQQIDAWKVSFITKRLNLTPAEAKVFWPIYNQYETELETLRKNHRNARQAMKDDFSAMSDKEIEKMVDAEIAFKQNEIDILKKYHAQFKQVLPMKKVAKLYKAEEDFKKEILKRYRQQQ
jgi:molecular chaperone DnaK (HSP70)